MGTIDLTAWGLMTLPGKAKSPYIKRPKVLNHLTRRLLRTPRTVGPLSRFNEETAGAILQALADGCYLETAAAAAGLRKETLHDWLRWGNEGRQPYADFLAQATQARATAEARDVAFIGKSDDWRAHAWRLERMHGKAYAGVTVTEARLEVDARTTEEITARARSIYGLPPMVALAASTTHANQTIEAEYVEAKEGQQGAAQAASREDSGLAPEGGGDR